MPKHADELGQTLLAVCVDVEAYRRERLKAFVALLGHFGLNRPPIL